MLIHKHGQLSIGIEHTNIKQKLYFIEHYVTFVIPAYKII